MSQPQPSTSAAVVALSQHHPSTSAAVVTSPPNKLTSRQSADAVGGLLSSHLSLPLPDQHPHLPSTSSAKSASMQSLDDAGELVSRNEIIIPSGQALPTQLIHPGVIPKTGVNVSSPSCVIPSPSTLLQELTLAHDSRPNGGVDINDTDDENFFATNDDADETVKSVAQPSTKQPPVKRASPKAGPKPKLKPSSSTLASVFTKPHQHGTRTGVQGKTRRVTNLRVKVAASATPANCSEGTTTKRQRTSTADAVDAQPSFVSPAPPISTESIVPIIVQASTEPSPVPMEVVNEDKTVALISRFSDRLDRTLVMMEESQKQFGRVREDLLVTKTVALEAQARSEDAINRVTAAEQRLEETKADAIEAVTRAAAAEARSEESKTVAADALVRSNEAVLRVEQCSEESRARFVVAEENAVATWNAVDLLRDQLERTRRLSEVIIRGVPLVGSETINDLHCIVNSLATAVGCSLAHRDVESVRVLTTHGANQRANRMLLLRFSSVALRHEFFMGYMGVAGGLRVACLGRTGPGNSDRLYITDNLTVRNTKIRREAVALVRSGQLASQLTRDGLVHVRVNGDQRAYPVNTLDELSSLVRNSSRPHNSSTPNPNPFHTPGKRAGPNGLNGGSGKRHSGEAARGPTARRQ